MASGESRSFGGECGSRGLIAGVKGIGIMMTSKLILSVLLLATLLLVNAKSAGHAHSFQHFHGPVMGDDQEVIWRDDDGRHHEDYVAHPHYAFSYGVEDRRTGDYHGQKEYRDGTEVFGEYTVKDADGNIRTVKYRAGKDGFHAQVHNSHQSGNPVQQHYNSPPSHPPPPSPPHHHHHHHHHQPEEYH
ncbi:uncharacterized protein LOC105181584 [Harpegnathos saltator]|uniref:Cuticle protein n=1 Tax=Harpegnathos saltator TaxID=610380 RepID=E2BDE6_HARSA|nr:uncharacterized protein LOC105181584 [Harpegnathos saltator]EFN86258.1 Cuticle protein [Harpegnathos saltator]